MRSCFRVLLLALPLLLGEIAWAQQKGAPPWSAAKTAIEAWYKKERPEARIVEVVPADDREIGFLGWAVRHHAYVTVAQPDQLRDREHVTVIFVRVAGKWEVDEVKAVESAALPDVEQPSAADALRLFRDAWKKDKCRGFDIREVKAAGEPRFQRERVSGDRTKARRWFLYDLEITATGNGDFRMSEEGQPYLLKTQNALLWNPAEKSWSVDPQWVRCTGFMITGSVSLPSRQPPPADDALRMLREVWKKDKCEGYDITDVKVPGAPRYKAEDISVADYRNKARRWFIYELEISAIGNGDFRLSEQGQPYVLRTQNLLLWNPTDQTWSVDLQSVKCSGFTKTQKK